MANRRVGLVFANIIAGSILPMHYVPAAAEQIVEEVLVVGSRLRAESLEDAPVAVAVVDGEALDDLNLTELQDISQMAASINLNPGRSDSLSIRGIGAGGDTGFDQSVGIVIDDVPFSRGRWTTSGMFDVQQIEILKGPQGVYLGKNATAGALYIRSRDPGPEREFSLTAGTEFEADERYLELIASGQLADNFGARLALRTSEMKDGWFEQLDTDSPLTDETMARLTLKWDINDSLSNTVKLTVDDREDAMINIATQRYACPGGGPAPTFGLLANPGEDCRLDDKGTLDGQIPRDYTNGLTWEWESWIATNKLEWQTSNWTLTSITSLSKYETEYADDYDFAASPSIYAYEEETNEQFNQELRLVTQLDGSVQFMLGAFYEDTDFFHRNSSVLFNQEFLDIATGGLFPLTDPATGRNFLWDRFNDQDGESYGAYAEISWRFNEDWKLDVGGRYSDVSKDSLARNVYVHSLIGVFVFPLEPVGVPFRDDYDDDDFSPQAILTWEPNDDLTLFLSYTEAFKAGGFAHGTTLISGISVDDMTFDAESAKGFNLGMKTSLMGGRIYLSAVAYALDYEDLQQNVFNSESTSFTVANAGAYEVTGLDLDLNWRIDDNWTLNGSFVWLDSTIEDFIGACIAGQTVEQGCNVGFDPTTPSGGLSYTRGSAQDRSGTSIAPDFEAIVGLRYERVLVSGATVRGYLSGHYRDEVEFQPVRGVPTYNDYTRWDASLTYAAASGHWEATLYGKNLTDEIITTGWVDTPGTGGTSGLTAASPGAGAFADAGGGIERTRQIGLSFTLRL